MININYFNIISIMIIEIHITIRLDKHASRVLCIYNLNNNHNNLSYYGYYLIYII